MRIETLNFKMSEFFEVSIPNQVIIDSTSASETEKVESFQHWGPLISEIMRRALDPARRDEFVAKKEQDLSRPRERVTIWRGDYDAAPDDVEKVSVTFCSYTKEPSILMYVYGKESQHPVYGPTKRKVIYEIGNRYFQAFGTEEQPFPRKAPGLWTAVIAARDIRTSPNLETRVRYISERDNPSTARLGFTQKFNDGYETAETISGGPAQYEVGPFGSGVQHGGPRYGEEQVKFSIHRGNLHVHLPLILRRDNTVAILKFWLDDFSRKMLLFGEMFLRGIPDVFLSQILYQRFIQDLAYKDKTKLLERLGEMTCVISEQTRNCSGSLGVDSSIPSSMTELYQLFREEEMLANPAFFLELQSGNSRT